MSNIKKIFGQNVRYYRYQKNYTQQKFAELTDTNHTYISDIERGKYSVSFEKLELFAKVLDVEVAQLFEVRKQKVPRLPRRVDMVKKVKN